MQHKAINSLKTRGLEIIEPHIAEGNYFLKPVVDRYYKVVEAIDQNLPKAEKGHKESCQIIGMACLDLIEVLEFLFETYRFYIFEFSELVDFAEAIIDEVNDMSYDEQAHDMLAELTDDED